MPLELWLSQLGHATRADRRMLLKAATTLVDMPATFTAFRAGQITWSQIRAIVDAASRLRKDERAELDAALVDDLATARSEEPDEITWRVVLFAAELEASRVETSEAETEPAVNRTMMQSRLDGTGGLPARGQPRRARRCFRETLASGGFPALSETTGCAGFPETASATT